MPWKKEEKVFAPPLVVNGVAWWHPTDEMMIAAGWTWEDPPAPPTPTVYTKRKIRLAMRKMGIEAKLDAVLSNASIYQAWIEAQEIDLANDDFKSAFAASGVTEAELAEICRIINAGEVEVAE